MSEETISSLNVQFAATPIIIGGDFNSRIGDLNQLEEEMQFQLNSTISPRRTTCDVIINRRGKFLTELTEHNNFLVLNERCNKDNPAQITYLNKVGKNIIDLIITNHQHYSDLFPCKISLLVKQKVKSNRLKQKIDIIIWTEETANLYKKLINNIEPELVTNPQIIYTHTTETIRSVAEQCEMSRTITINYEHRKKIVVQ